MKSAAKEADPKPPECNAQTEPDQMARSCKERARHFAVLPAYSCRRHLYVSWQAGYHKADDEPEDTPSQRGADSRKNAVERTPPPADAQPSQSVK